MANYLYNGVELPDIGAIWDKETHPHAFIYYNSLAGYTVRFSSGEISWKNTLQVLVPAPSVGYDLVDGTWVLESEKTSDYTFNFTSTYSGVWTNHDILNSDGSVYLAASDPIPVAPIDPTAMLLGWLTGRKVAGMRGKGEENPVEPAETWAVQDGEKLTIYVAYSATQSDAILEVE